MGRASDTARRSRRTMLVKEKKPAKQLVLRKRLRKLKKIVPGCRDAGLELLLVKTAQYVSFLELQVIVLKTLLHGQ